MLVLIGGYKLRVAGLQWMAGAAAMAAICCGCAVSKKTTVKPGEAPAPLQTATKEQLVADYNKLASAVTSVNATVTMKLTAGSAYSGVIEQYHEVNGFILAQRPKNIRVIGQAPVVGKNIFDMVSDGETFHIYIPSKAKFIVGPANLERPAKKPVEKLRPQHLLDAIFLPSIPEGLPVLFEEASEGTSQYYVLTVIRAATSNEGATNSSAPGSTDWEIARKIWFDRTNLSVARTGEYGAGGNLISDVRYGGWDTFGDVKYARQITFRRPGDDYQLEIGVKKLTANEPVSADRFVLQQPPGTELVDMGKESEEPKP
jgi:outer membrane lipoprotein-sorting protein